MRELSLHILDVVQNSLAAGATEIAITVAELTRDNKMRIEICDNGRGMAPQELQLVLDPFYTSRHTRKVGLGLSLFQAAAIRCGGDFQIVSQPGQGTRVMAEFQHAHIDRAPLGNIAETMVTLIICNPDIRFCYRHCLDGRVYQFDSVKTSVFITGEDILPSQAAQWLKTQIQQGIDSLTMV